MATVLISLLIFFIGFIIGAAREKVVNKNYSEKDLIKYNIWFSDNCIYYDGWIIRVPLGDKYPEVYTQTEIFEIYKKEVL